MSVCDPRVDWIAVVGKRLLRVRVTGSGAGVFEAVSDGVRIVQELSVPKEPFGFRRRGNDLAGMPRSLALRDAPRFSPFVDRRRPSGDSSSGQPPLPGRLLVPLDSVYILLNLGIHGLVRHID